MTASRILLALDILVNGPAPPGPPPPSLIPLSRARLCVEPDCALVSSIEEAQRCPACGSESVALDVMTRQRDGRVLAFRRRLAQRARASFLRDLEARRQEVSHG